MKIAIVYKGSGPGIEQDVRVIEAALSDRYSVDKVVAPSFDPVQYILQGPFRRLKRLAYTVFTGFFYALSLIKKPKYDLAIYIESCRPWYLWMGRKNILIPNQEWYFPELTCCLKGFDALWCKTYDAKGIFSKYHNNVSYMGFGSIVDKDRRQDKKNKNLILHRAGNSLIRGSATLIKVWSQHPEWPLLSVILSPNLRSLVWNKSLPSNVCYLDGCWNDSEFAELLASARIHIHPTEAEGYGLTISEALGYGCVLIVTNAPPMNELVTSSRGYLVEAVASKKFNLATTYSVVEASLAKTIALVLAEPPSSLTEKMSESMRWFDENNTKFVARINYLTEINGINAKRLS